MLYLLDRVLRLFWFLILGLSILAVVIMGVALVAADGPVDASFLTSPVSVEAYQAATGASDIVLENGDRVGIDTVSFSSGDPALVWPMVLVMVLGIALFLYGFHILRHIVADAAADAPFTPENVSRLRHLAFVALGLLLLESAAPLLASTLAAIGLRGEAFHAEFSLGAEPASLVIVLVLFALAEVFSRGVELQQENDLTV